MAQKVRLFVPQSLINTTDISGLLTAAEFSHKGPSDIGPEGCCYVGTITDPAPLRRLVSTLGLEVLSVDSIVLGQTDNF